MSNSHPAKRVKVKFLWGKLEGMTPPCYGWRGETVRGVIHNCRFADMGLGGGSL